MTLTELSALETAYHVLRPLDDTARRRALQWLSDALSQNQPLMTSAGELVTSEPAAAVAAVTRTRPRRRAAQASTAATPKSMSAKKVKASVHSGAGGKRAGKTASTEGQERAYRRMPDPATVMKAYERIGTITGLAEHFDVPHHTVTHWARRLRAQGYQIGRNG
ncbi:MAG TPA: hypothetical protein VFC19_14830 [Candidatus Limnocylindrales bacterium]|nr:hypothetical protein [Candidatus Limnocylindrales bacterium]